MIHLADHPEDQAYVDDLMAANAELAQAFARPLSQPVPERLRATIERRAMRGVVLPFMPRTLFALGATSLAASIAMLVFARPAAESDLIGPGTLARSHPLHQPVSTLASGVPTELGDGRVVTVLATLPTKSGPCREVEIIDRPAARLDMLLTCREATGWSIAVVLSEPLSSSVDEDGYVPAGGAETSALDLWLTPRGAGAALSATDEAALIAHDWQDR